MVRLPHANTENFPNPIQCVQPETQIVVVAGKHGSVLVRLYETPLRDPSSRPTKPSEYPPRDIGGGRPVSRSFSRQSLRCPHGGQFSMFRVYPRPRPSWTQRESLFANFAWSLSPWSASEPASPILSLASDSTGCSRRTLCMCACSTSNYAISHFLRPISIAFP